LRLPAALGFRFSVTWLAAWGNRSVVEVALRSNRLMDAQPDRENPPWDFDAE
jgi:hypothetical protein